MKKLLLSILLVSGIFCIALIYSCSKSSTTSPSSTTPTQTSSLTNAQTSSDDQNYYKSENDQANSDVNTDMSNYSTMQGRIAEGSSFQGTFPHPCGCPHPDTSHLSTLKEVIYTFDGVTNCGGRIRSGTITVQLTSGNKWSDAGAVLTFSTTNYSVKRLWDGKTITFSGTKTLQNVNGSSLIQWLEFFAGDLTLEVRERTVGLNVTFNSGRQATWNTAYTTAWNYDTIAKVYLYKANGDTTVNGYTNTYAWGTDRFDSAFYDHLTSPLICNSNCGYWQPMSGAAIYNIGNATLTLTLGVNQNGTPYTGTGCPWGYDITWALGNGNNGSANFQYW